MYVLLVCVLHINTLPHVVVSSNAITLEFNMLTMPFAFMFKLSLVRSWHLDDQMIATMQY